MKQTDEKGKPLTYWGGLEETKHSKVLSENGSELFFDKEGSLIKEEPKPHTFCETPEEKCTMNYCDENGCQNRKRELVEPKQETLEEAKLRQLFKNRSNCFVDADDVVQAMDEDCFIKTVKEWKQDYISKKNIK